MTTPDPSLPKVTVAICTYNRAHFLQQTLAGVSLQDYSADCLEVLVIDNNSTDDTRAVVYSFADQPHPPRHAFEVKQGLDAARNRGLSEATGEIILFADDDILVSPDWVSQMAKPFQTDTDKKIGIVGGEVVPVFPDGLPAWISEWHAPLAFRSDVGEVAPSQSPMGANLAIPKWIFEKVGPFASGLDRQGGNLFGGGDEEMVRRVRTAGFQIWFAPAASVQHQMPSSRTTFRYAARHAFDSARSRVFLRRAEGSDSIGYLLSRFLGNILKAIGYTLIALINTLLFRRGEAKKALVRAWRSCGYLYQIPQSLWS